jgi:hypothetical protein
LAKGFIKQSDEEPVIEGFEFYLDAFRDLSTSRPVGMELGSIPFTAIAEYFKIYELSDFDDFAYIIRLMDRTFIELNEETNKSGGDKRGKRSAKKGDKNSS